MSFLFFSTSTLVTYIFTTPTCKAIVTWNCVSIIFWWLSPNHRKWWDNLNQWSIELMDVLAKNAKREDGLQLVILKEPHFAYRCFCYFWCFCCLQVMEFGVLFFMECWHPNKMLMVERYFLDYFFGGAWFAEGREKGIWWEEEINT